MAQVGITGIAQDLYADHTITGILVVADGIILHWLRETRPSGTRIKFKGGVEQQCTTTGAGIFTGSVGFAIGAGKWCFGTFFSHDTELFRRQFFLPFLIGTFHTVVRARGTFCGEGKDVDPLEHVEIGIPNIRK